MSLKHHCVLGVQHTVFTGGAQGVYAGAMNEWTALPGWHDSAEQRFRDTGWGGAGTGPSG